MLDLDRYSYSIAAICERLAVKRLEIFGSALREDFDPTSSDIDLFYEFAGSADLFSRFMDLKRELEKLFGRKVDLLKEDQIQNPFVKERIARSPRKRLYAA